MKNMMFIDMIVNKSETFLKKELKDSGFDVNEPIDGLLVVNNFLSKNDILEYFNIINNTKEEDWHIQYTEGLKTFCMQKFGRDDVENLVAEGKFEITEGWKDKNLNISNYPITQRIYQKIQPLIEINNPGLELNGFGSFQRMQESIQLTSHVDQHTDPSIQYAAIIYLNDDYGGGEIFFKNKNFEIKPTPGSLLIFPGNDEFEHGVRPVENATIRYVVIGFIRIKNFYDTRKY